MDEDTNEPRPLFFEVTADFRAESARLIERVQFEIAFSFFFFLFPFHRDKFVPRIIIIIMGSKIFHAIFDTGEREEMGERKKGEIYSISGKSNETRPATILAKRPATTKSGFLSSERGPFYWRHRCFLHPDFDFLVWRRRKSPCRQGRKDRPFYPFENPRRPIPRYE